MIPRQQYLDFGPLDQFQLLHGSHQADIALAHKGHRWLEQVYPHGDAPAMMLEMAGWDDSYVGQNGFTKKRGVGTVQALTACWVDLDTYTVPGLDGIEHDELLDQVLKAHPWLPAPTAVIFSGRGYYFVWKFSRDLSQDHLPAWQAVMNVLTDLLSPFAADAHSKDAARVLRIVRSRNSKSGELVTVHQTGQALPFEKLERAVLGAGAAAQKVKTKERFQVITGDFALEPYCPRSPSKATSAQRAQFIQPLQLAYDRMQDCATIAQLRGSPRMSDCRHRLLYVYAISGAWYWSNLEQARDELEAFSSRHFDQADRYNSRRVTTVLDRMQQGKDGIVQIWEGHRVDRRYRMKNETIIRTLRLTPDEQFHLKTIIDADERNRRRQERRREAGKVSRAEYLGQAEERRQKALELRQQGLSQKAIAAEMGVTQQAVSAMLRHP